MFGKPQDKRPPAAPQRKAAADVARIQGGGLVQVIVTSLVPMNYYLFLNDQPVSQMDIESLNISIETPEATGTGTPIVRATLTRYVKTVTGERVQQSAELFPCTLEIVALGRRLSLTCTEDDSLEGLWIDLGLNPNGTGNELTGVRSLRFLVSEDFLDAKLTWEDGETEDLLPQ